MKTLLEEGRKRRRNKDDDDVVDRGLPGPGMKKRSKGIRSKDVGNVADAGDLNKLVERLKGGLKGSNRK
ncbi:hypothetical protein I7I51_08153 [Histoplasma capsulatum]|uniref:Uncharacterized protein n=1 Tax=Ajellomyces capsulatus TaxID=5037 RepID=A0A8A1M236_AJECA|nr:predicted protein [Histoplasma mississippiense (nom. inval.)]EDN03100.1 predicted protein [Histoplasma mississippiense (nom. inval.)]QSS58724.1 hypothetical protein I7I51_08153 [Histoplasma capsulatum]